MLFLLCLTRLRVPPPCCSQALVEKDGKKSSKLLDLSSNHRKTLDQGELSAWKFEFRVSQSGNWTFLLGCCILEGNYRVISSNRVQLWKGEKKTPCRGFGCVTDKPQSSPWWFMNSHLNQPRSAVMGYIRICMDLHLLHSRQKNIKLCLLVLSYSPTDNKRGIW